MKPEQIGITITYQEPQTFHLRMVGMTEEDELRQRFVGKTAKEKAEKQYQTNVDILAELSTEMPEGLFPNEPDAVSVADLTVYAKSFKKPEDAVRAYFAEKTVMKERVAEYAVRAYFLKLQPSIDFL